MNEKVKMTHQGIRDLNYYGPRRRTAAPVASNSTEEVMIVPTPHVAPSVIDAPPPSDK